MFSEVSVILSTEGGGGGGRIGRVSTSLLLTSVVGTHPTGMHSCNMIFCKVIPMFVEN